MPAPALSDAELVRKCQNGDLQAYNELVTRHQDRLFTLLYRYLGNWEDACDLCQEVFLKAFRALREFRGEAAFGTWLHRIGVNAVISLRRAKHPQTAVLNIGGTDGEEDERGRNSAGIVECRDPKVADPVQIADQKERERIIQQAIASLEEEQRMVIVLRDIEGYDYEEISRMLGCPRGTVKSRLHRARLALRDRLLPLLREDVNR